MNTQHMTIVELNKALVSGEITAKNLLEEAQLRIKNKDKEINAFIEVFDNVWVPDSVDTTASLLSGIPMAIKDNILSKGRKASSGSKILENYTATYDSHVAELLKKSGAVIVGRTNMDEFAMGSSTENSAYGPTKNPHNLLRVPGGTSGGSAAAVASGMLNYALGTDTGGSVRQPASFCGIVGLKPSYGAVSRRGLMSSASSFDVIGPLARNVQDAKTIFDVISEYDELDSTSISPKQRESLQSKNSNKKVIGIPRVLLNLDGLDKEVLENFEVSVQKMKEQGYSIVDIDIPYIENSLAVYYILQAAEVSSNLARFDGIRYGVQEESDNLLDTYLGSRTEGFGKEVKRRIMLGTHVLSSGYHDQYYNKAQALREKISQNIYAIFDTVDVIATPTAPTVAFEFNSNKDPISMYLQDVFTVPYSFSGNPAISIPSGKNHEGLPFGIHFVAPLFCEEKLFEVSSDFERAIINE